MRLLRERRSPGRSALESWVPFNESWGVPDLPLVAAQRDFVPALVPLP